MDKRTDENQDTRAVELTPAQRSLTVNLRQKRTLLTICEYYQRHAAAAEAEIGTWLDNLVDALRAEIADISRLLRLYDVPPASVYAARSQVDEARYVKSREARLALLLARVKATMRWYEHELAADPPGDVAELWTEFLAAEQQRVQQIERMLAEVQPAAA